MKHPSASASVAAIVLAAGQGTRMKSALPKVMHLLAGHPLVHHVSATLDALSPTKRIYVIGPDMDSVASTVAPCPCVVQTERLGTAHAVLQTREALDGFDGTALVLYGDTPLVRPETLQKMIDARNGADDPAVVVLGFVPDEPSDYGRLICDERGDLLEIVEARDATEEQKAVRLCNSGVMAFDGRVLFDLLSRIDNQNAKGEFYLTDMVALARASGRRCVVVSGSPDEFAGVNSKADLATLEALIQNRLRARALEQGVTLSAPETVFLSADTTFGTDVSIAPFVSFGPKVHIGNGVRIHSFCHLEDCTVEDGVVLGPYARLRPGALIGPDAHIGNFVEIKKASVEQGAKINHLSYIGDARVGAGSNIGAGTITCNYDGFSKHHTDIGERAFIGSNTALVAPVVIGDGALIGAGSTISRNVEADALSLTRAKQETHPGWAAAFRKRLMRSRKS